MSKGLRRPHEAVDYAELARRFPPPPEYFETTWFDDPETIERKQLARLRERASAAWRVPFFQRRWSAAGVDPSRLAHLADLDQIPTYSVDDIRLSIEAEPPWGDYQGVVPSLATREPMRAFMSGGTTGASRPTFYTQWDREVGAITLARQLWMQGVRPGDIVMNAWSYGTHNGAFAFDEALYRWLCCVVLTTSTGNVTSSAKQVQLAVEYEVAAILTTGDYLLRLAEVAAELGYDVKRDLKLRALSNIGDRERLERTFGLPVYDSYGFHEVQCVAVECAARHGLHIFEDCFVVQVVDPESGAPLPDGETGSLVVTELYKTGSPQFRYNIMDLSYLYPRERCECGSWTRRMAPFAGRGDNMVKLRGVNVWPEAIGDLVNKARPDVSDYFVRAVRAEGRDELIVMVASSTDPAARASVSVAIEQMLRDRLGVRVLVEVVGPGELDVLTGAGVMPKLKRFRDER